jgi:hypothetical protein
LHAWLAMPPAPHEYVGRDAIAAFLPSSSTWRPELSLRLSEIEANNQFAYAVCLDDARRVCWF